MSNNIAKSTAYGILASAIMLGVYFTVLTLVSGWNFAKVQFSSYWYFIISLAAGFGIQIGLFMYLKDCVKNEHDGGKILGVTGTTSTFAMISCCAHYLVNLIPIIGIAGIVTLITQYQIEFFWIGLLFNISGIIYIVNRIIRFVKT